MDSKYFTNSKHTAALGGGHHTVQRWGGRGKIVPRRPQQTPSISKSDKSSLIAIKSRQNLVFYFSASCNSVSAGQKRWDVQLYFSCILALKLIILTVCFQIPSSSDGRVPSPCSPRKYHAVYVVCFYIPDLILHLLTSVQTQNCQHLFLKILPHHWWNVWLLS